MVVEETWQTYLYFKDEVSRQTLFDLIHNKSLKIPKNRQRPKGQEYTHKTKDHTLKYRVWAPQGQTDYTLKYRAWAPQGQHNGHGGGGGCCCCCCCCCSGINVYGCCCCCYCSGKSVYGCCCCSGYGILSFYWSIWIVSMNSFFFSGKIWILAGNLNVGGRLLRSFPVHHFRWRHFRWCNFWSLPVILLLVTSLLLTAPPQMINEWCFYTTKGLKILLTNNR